MFNADNIRKSLTPKKRKSSDAAANALGGLSGKVVEAKKKHKKYLDAIAKEIK